MKDKHSTYSQLDLTRRDMLRVAGGAASAVAVGAATGMLTPAAAADSTVRGYGVTTAQLKDWSIMTKSIGVNMEFTGTNNSVGVFLRDVVASQLGDKVDIFIFESGTEDILGPQGVYLPIDEKHPELTLWDRTPDDWKRSEVVQDSDGKQYGVPVIGNADSFGYFPDKLGVAPDSDDEISWAVLFDDDKTRGRVAYDQTWTYSLGPAALYLSAKTGQKFGEIADSPRKRRRRSSISSSSARRRASSAPCTRRSRSRSSCSPTRRSTSSTAGSRRRARPT